MVSFSLWWWGVGLTRTSGPLSTTPSLPRCFWPLSGLGQISGCSPPFWRTMWRLYHLAATISPSPWAPSPSHLSRPPLFRGPIDGCGHWSPCTRCRFLFSAAYAAPPLYLPRSPLLLLLLVEYTDLLSSPPPGLPLPLAPAGILRMNPSRWLLLSTLLVQQLMPLLTANARPPPFAPTCLLSVRLSDLCIMYHSILGVGYPSLSFVSCRTATSNSSSLSRPTNSSVLVPSQSRFHWRSFMLPLCLPVKLSRWALFLASYFSSLGNVCTSRYCSPSLSPSSGLGHIWGASLLYTLGSLTLFSLLPHSPQLPRGSSGMLHWACFTHLHNSWAPLPPAPLLRTLSCRRVYSGTNTTAT